MAVRYAYDYLVILMAFMVEVLGALIWPILFIEKERIIQKYIIDLL